MSGIYKTLGGYTPYEKVLLEQNRKLEEQVRRLSASRYDKHYVRRLEEDLARELITNKIERQELRQLRNRCAILESVIRSTIGLKKEYITVTVKE